MRVTSAYFKGVIVVAGLVFLTAGVLFAMTAPNATRREPAASVSVDRTNKGDRLSYASISKTHASPSLVTTTPQTPPQQRPLGCDATFSSLADPTRAHIYKRCMA